MQVSYANEIRDKNDLATLGNKDHSKSNGGKDIFANILNNINNTSSLKNLKGASFINTISSNSINALKQSVAKSKTIDTKNVVQRGNDFTKVKKDLSDKNKVDLKDKDQDTNVNTNAFDESKSESLKKDVQDVVLPFALSANDAMFVSTEDISDVDVKSSIDLLNASNTNKNADLKDASTLDTSLNTTKVITDDGKHLNTVDSKNTQASKTLSSFAGLDDNSNVLDVKDFANIKLNDLNKDLSKHVSDNTDIKSDVLQSLDKMASKLNVSKISLDDIKDTAHIKASDSAFSEDLDIIEKSMAQTISFEKNSVKNGSKLNVFNFSQTDENKVHTTLGDMQKGISNMSDISKALATLKMGIKNENFQNFKLSTNATTELSTRAFADVNKVNSSMNQNLSNGSNSNEFAQGQGQSSLVKNGIESNKLATNKDSFYKMSLSQNSTDNAKEIANKVMAMASRNLKEMTIDLNPQNLGKMQIKIALTKSQEAGMVSIAAASPHTKEMLDSSMGTLRDIMAQSGIITDTNVHDLIDVSSSFDQNFSGQNQDSHNEDKGFYQNDVIFASNDEIADDATIESESLSVNENGNLSILA